MKTLISTFKGSFKIVCMVALVALSCLIYSFTLGKPAAKVKMKYGQQVYFSTVNAVFIGNTTGQGRVINDVACGYPFSGVHGTWAPNNTGNYHLTVYDGSDNLIFDGDADLETTNPCN